ncbi:hypothetical protein C0Q70_00724 [Pomacea canaliculata]|uniref:Uncharacterized protein n=1 Tax=Pomacea canaliculata TaxID=400727 RepID=A0A2T7PXF7_POMCA|nr:hypothetical protein C0Q70_00724 [Pomacea canaliculata]
MLIVGLRLFPRCHPSSTGAKSLAPLFGSEKRIEKIRICCSPAAAFAATVRSLRLAEIGSTTAGAADIIYTADAGGRQIAPEAGPFPSAWPLICSQLDSRHCVQVHS